MKGIFNFRLDVTADLLINLSATWFALIFVEPQINKEINILILFTRFIFGIITLNFANIIRNLSEIE